MDNEVLAYIHTKTALILLGLLISLLLVYNQRFRTKIRIQQWQKTLNLSKHSSVFHQLYKDVNGFTLSRQARKKHDALEYVYGEIDFVPFIALLSLAQPNKETVFYDLGSGTGKAVLACALVYPVKKSAGVELLPELYNSACNQAKKLAQMKGYAEQEKKIEFIKGDFLRENLDDATLIFINSTALFGPTWENLCSNLDNLPNLNTVISTSKPLLSDRFPLVKSTKIQMSWGVVTAYLHARKTNFN